MSIVFRELVVLQLYVALIRFLLRNALMIMLMNKLRVVENAPILI